MNLNLGLPIDNMTLIGSEYIRHFSGGEIRVNPTAKTSNITLKLTLTSTPINISWSINDGGFINPNGVYQLQPGSVKLTVPSTVT